MRYALSMAMMATLAGCASVEDPFLTGSVSGANPIAPALTQEVSSSHALAGLASAVGAPRSVRQTAPGGEETIRQVIVYANTTKLAGENVLVVEGGRGADGRYRRAPSRNQLIAEMNSALPGVPMRISPVIGENAYGVYGYATAPYAGGACIYAWQVAHTGGKGLSDGRLAGREYPAQVRLRFCHERISEARIPLLMQSLAMKPLTGATIAMLRNVRGSGMAHGAPLYGNDMLFEASAERLVSPAYAAPAVAEGRIAAAPAPRRVAAAPVREEKPAPVILDAARVPMPGEQPAEKAQAAAPQSPETAAGLKRKAADAWNVTRARLSGPAEPAR